MFFTEIKIQGDPFHLHGYDIDNFRGLLASHLSIPRENVRFETAGSGCIILVFLIPEIVRADLRRAALERATWLVDADVAGIHIDGEDYVSLIDTDKGKFI